MSITAWIVPQPTAGRPRASAGRPHRSVRRRDTSRRPTVTATGSPAAQPLYDARRGVYYAKPVLRGWLHLLWFGASLVSGPLLLAGAARSRADHGGRRLLSQRERVVRD